MSPMVLLFLAYLLGVLSARGTAPPPLLFFYFLFLTSFFGGLCMARSEGKRLAVLFLYLAVFILGFLRCVLQLFPTGPCSMRPWMYALRSGALHVEGTVETPPVRSEDQRGARYSFVFHCEAIETPSGAWHPVEGRLRVTLRSEEAPLAGGFYRMRAWYPGPSFPRNPGSFDYASYLRWKGLEGHVYARAAGEGFKLLKSPSKVSCAAALSRVDAWMRRNLAVGLPERTKGLVIAMILGHKDALARETQTSLQRAGLAHIMAVSGLHVMGLCFLIDGALRRLRLPSFLHEGLLLACLFGYSALVGFRAPVVRASLMAFFLLMGRRFHRPSHGPSSLSAAGLLLLLWRPLGLFSVSFQFSFAGVAGIFLLRPLLSSWAERLWKKPVRNGASGQTKVLRGVLEVALMTLSVQLMTAPLAARFFQQVSLTASLSNIIVVPLVPFLMAAALLKAGLGALHPGLALLPRLATEMLAWLIVTVAHGAEKLPWAYCVTPQPTWPQVACLYGMLLSWSAGFYRRRLLIVACLCFLLSLAWERQSRRGHLEGVFLDVGQGDAAVLRLPTGEVMTIDAGPRAQEGRCAFQEYLQRKGVRRISLAVLSHPDADHIGGLQETFSRLRIEEALCSPFPGKTSTWRRCEEGMREQEVCILFAEGGAVMDMGRGVKAEIWGPHPHADLQSTNDASVVLCLTYQGFRILFTGDLETRGEERMLRNRSLKEVHLLKVSHHGAGNASQWPFLKKTRPQLSVISVGRDNPYGHPSEMLLFRLGKMGCPFHRTDEEGALLFRIEKGRFRFTTMRDRWRRGNEPPNWWLRAWNLPGRS